MQKILISSLVLCAWMATTPAVWAVDPNPLKNAYWRFEEGTDGVAVVPGFDNVLDTADNSADPPDVPGHMRAANLNTAPTYTSTVAPTPLLSGLSNNLALSFTPHTGGGDDLFTRNDGDPNPGPDINNGIIAPGEGFTLEAAFRPAQLGAFQGIVTKEGQPAAGDLGGDFIENLPTLALKVRGDTNVLQIEQWDAAQNLVQVSSLNSLSVDQWYYAAVVNTGTELSLYLDSNDGAGYQLQGSTPVDGALFQENDDWSHAWAIGRGQFGGGPADWFNGIIDEVRLTNQALEPSQFLFAIPEPGCAVLMLLALVGLVGRPARRV